MWTAETRHGDDRGGLRTAHEPADDAWAAVAPLAPPAKRGGKTANPGSKTAKRGSKKRAVDIREIPIGTMHVPGTDCQWCDIPKDLPPESTVYHRFVR